MIQRSSEPPRGPRHGSPSIRGGGRGGIQKRRAGPVRVDKDGDLDMDAGTTGGRGRSGKGRLESPVPPRAQGAGRGRGAGPGLAWDHRPTKQAILRGLGAQQANVLEARITTSGTTLRVDGLKSSKAASNSDGGLEALLSFLERKAKALDPKSNSTVKIKKSQIKGHSVIITASPEDIAEIQKLDQFQFAGAVLSIQPCETTPPRSGRAGEKKEETSPDTKETKERLKAILAARYNANLKLLDLSALGQDVGLVQMGLGSLEGKVTSKLFPALMVVCDGLFTSWQAKRDAIASITLAGNALANVSIVTSLAITFPDLRNLDLSGNNFTDLKSLEAWRWKFRHLENLVLTNNPIETQSPGYKVEIMRWYPKLQILNGVQIRTVEEINAAAEAANSPIPISGPDFRDVAHIGENFVKSFFPLYDTDRATLLATFYDAQTRHSISINMQAPRDRNHSTAIPPWASYIQHSRNLTRITRTDARMSRQYRGIQAIQKVWSGLPSTRHPNLLTSADKYLIECHHLPGLSDPAGGSPRGVDGLILTVHGEFEEETNPTEKGLRSFSRTFILGPGAPGAPPIRVVSDVMVLRAWAPLAMPSHSASPAEINNPQPQNQEGITRQLVEKTGMTPEYSIMCLTETGWDLGKAFIAFNANKDKLPPNAFIASVGK